MSKIYGLSRSAAVKKPSLPCTDINGLPYHHYYSLRKVSEMLPVNIDSALVFGVVFQQNGKLYRIAGDNAQSGYSYVFGNKLVVNVCAAFVDRNLFQQPELRTGHRPELRRVYSSPAPQSRPGMCTSTLRRRLSER